MRANGCYSYWHSSRFKNQHFKTLIDYLHGEDYYTCADLISGLVLPRKNFDYYEVYDENDINLEARHSELLDKMKEKFDNGQNFFLYLHYSGIHTGIKDQVLKVFDNFSKEYFENKELNVKRYAKLFKEAETYLNSTMNKIKDLGLLENSIILILSDHGIGIGEKIGERAYGAFCYDYTLKTFAYLYNADITPQVISSQVRHIDFMPTILNMLDIKINDSFYDRKLGCCYRPRNGQDGQLDKNGNKYYVQSQLIQ